MPLTKSRLGNLLDHDRRKVQVEDVGSDVLAALVLVIQTIKAQMYFVGKQQSGKKFGSSESAVNWSRYFRTFCCILQSSLARLSGSC